MFSFFAPRPRDPAVLEFFKCLRSLAPEREEQIKKYESYSDITILDAIQERIKQENIDSVVAGYMNEYGITEGYVDDLVRLKKVLEIIRDY